MTDINNALAYINTVITVRKHCSKDCKIHPWLLPGGNKDRWCKQGCILYKYRRFSLDNTNDYHVILVHLRELIEQHCFRDCGHEHCNNCTFRKYHEAYGK